MDRKQKIEEKGETTSIYILFFNASIFSLFHYVYTMEYGPRIEKDSQIKFLFFLLILKWIHLKSCLKSISCISINVPIFDIRCSMLVDWKLKLSHYRWCLTMTNIDVYKYYKNLNRDGTRSKHFYAWALELVVVFFFFFHFARLLVSWVVAAMATAMCYGRCCCREWKLEIKQFRAIYEHKHMHDHSKHPWKFHTGLE